MKKRFQLIFKQIPRVHVSNTFQGEFLCSGEQQK